MCIVENISHLIQFNMKRLFLVNSFPFLCFSYFFVVLFLLIYLLYRFSFYCVEFMFSVFCFFLFFVTCFLVKGLYNNVSSVIFDF